MKCFGQFISQIMKSKVKCKINYAFQSDSIEQINNTLFVRLTINSYLDTLKQARMSLYNDFDLGCPLDDMVGTSESTNSIYAYNLTSEDLKSCYPNKSFKSDSKPINYYFK